MSSIPKILFVTKGYGPMVGGGKCSQRNYEMLLSLCGPENLFRVDTGELNKLKKWRYKFETFLNRYMYDISFSVLKEIDYLIRNKNISIVFLDSSMAGRLAKRLKHKYPKLSVITFFHNLEYDLICDAPYGGLKKKIYLYLSKVNEIAACKYSDKIVALNDRDTCAIENRYMRKVDLCIPISLPDIYDNRNRIEPPSISDETKTALFIGSYFYPNVQGITWFVDNVLPLVDINLIIVGSGMNKLAIDRTKNIEIYDSVESLVDFYEKADFMIMPIFSGSGMKVKTAEALMYGKTIIGTKEAFEGYNVTSDIGFVCSSVEDFVNKINMLKLRDQKYNPEARRVYEQSYSYASTLPLFKKLLTEENKI